MMKEYIEKVENKENERIREIRKKREEQVQELIRLYSKKSMTTIIEPEKKGEILKDLLQQYGSQKQEISSNKISKGQKLAPDTADLNLRSTPRKISVSPRLQKIHFSSTSTTSTDSSEQMDEQKIDPTREESKSPESFNKKSSRPRPTTLKLTLNYETDCDAITLD